MRAFILLLALPVLGACGLRGSLYLPPPKTKPVPAAQPAPAAPNGQAPAEDKDEKPAAPAAPR